MMGKKNYKFLGFLLVLILILIFILVYFGFLIRKRYQISSADGIFQFGEISVNIPKSTVSVGVKPKPVDTVISVVVTNQNCKKLFHQKRAMVIGDSMAEGLSAYGVFDSVDVVWVRGRRIDMVDKDMESVLEQKPDVLFLAYGLNDLEMWGSRVDSFIRCYRNAIEYLHQVLPDTKIVINSVLPVSKMALEKSSVYQYQSLFNTSLQVMAKEENIPFLENSSYLTSVENPYTTDGIHPQAFFFFEWGKNMTRFLYS